MASDDEAMIIATMKKRCRGDLPDPMMWLRQGFAWDASIDAVPAPLGNIARENASSLLQSNFVHLYDEMSKPCIISGCSTSWPAWRGAWNLPSLLELYGTRPFKCGEDDDGRPVRLQLKSFLAYMAQQRDDSPAYIFDSMFTNGRRCGILDDYTVPVYFSDDLLSLVGENRRPPYRWFLIGPKRSGTRLHIDPLGTSAWNTIIQGRKRWVLFEPGVPVEHVQAKAYVRKDRGEDDEAIDYFHIILPRIKAAHPELIPRMIEFVQHPGETVWVPGYWWHAVLNLDDTVAITQNVCTTASFTRVWAEAIRNRRGMARKWLRVLRQERPVLAAAAIEYNSRVGISLTSQAKHHRQRRLEQTIRRAKRRAKLAQRALPAGAASSSASSDSSDSSTSSSSASSSSGSCTSSSSDSASPSRAEHASVAASKTSKERTSHAELTVPTQEGRDDANRTCTTRKLQKSSVTPAEVDVASTAADDDETEVEVSFRAYSAQRRKKARVASPQNPSAADAITIDGTQHGGESQRKPKSG